MSESSSLDRVPTREAGRPEPNTPEYIAKVRAEYDSLSTPKLRKRTGFLQRTIDGLDCRLGVALQMLRERERAALSTGGPRDARLRPSVRRAP